VEEADDLDAIFLYPIDYDVWGAVNDEFAGSVHAAFAAHFGKLGEQVRLAFDLLIHAGRRGWIVGGNIVQLLEPVVPGGLEPADDHPTA